RHGPRPPPVVQSLPPQPRTPPPHRARPLLHRKRPPGRMAPPQIQHARTLHVLRDPAGTTHPPTVPARHTSPTPRRVKPSGTVRHVMIERASGQVGTLIIFGLGCFPTASLRFLRAATS